MVSHSIVSCPKELFELLSFSTKNQISTLAAMTSDALGNLSQTRETMIFIIHSHGTIAVRKYCEVFFFSLGTQLIMKCVKFLLDTTSGGGDVLALVKETEENSLEANFDIFRGLRAVAKTVLQLPGIIFYYVW